MKNACNTRILPQVHEIGANSHVGKWDMAPRSASSDERLMVLGAPVAPHGDVPWRLSPYRLFYTFF